MNRRPGIASLVLLLAVLSSPTVGPGRPLDSLRLVVSISWLGGDQAEAEHRLIKTALLHPPTAAVVILPSSDSWPRSTALQPWLFQRPPPSVVLAL